ncbi:MAG TPA: hypothetical protein DDZ76_15845 [Xanthomonadales bacterium]|nr:hypothetical protein [Xanthomonadales bacterium]
MSGVALWISGALDIGGDRSWMRVPMAVQTGSIMCRTATVSVRKDTFMARFIIVSVLAGR